MSAENRSTPPVLDLEGTLERFGGDQDLFAELAGFLLKDLPPLFDELRGAIADGEARRIREKAHALKGLVAGCGGVRAAHVAQAIENAGQAEKISQASALVDTLDKELDLLTRELHAYHHRE